MSLRYFAALLCTCLHSVAAPVVIPVPITAPGTGFVSLALIDTNGVLARTLAYADPVRAGSNTFYWDGTTDLGWPAEPGAYTTRAAFFSNAPSLHFVTKVTDDLGERIVIPEIVDHR